MGDDLKKTMSSRHNRAASHKNSETVTAHTDLQKFKPLSTENGTQSPTPNQDAIAMIFAGKQKVSFLHSRDTGYINYTLEQAPIQHGCCVFEVLFVLLFVLLVFVCFDLRFALFFFFFFFGPGKKGREVGEDLGFGGGEGIHSKYIACKFLRIKISKNLKNSLTVQSEIKQNKPPT